MLGTCILFFLKYPELGKVKTRLAASVGDNRAMEAFTWMVETSWTGAQSEEWERQVCGTPSNQLGAFDAWLQGGKAATTQSDGSLGKRLEAGVAEAFSEGHRGVICVGGDCVQIRATHYQAMHEALKTHDLAILPARDGGYVAIGMKAPQPEIFQDIHWSTDTVLAETLAAAKHLRLSVWLGDTFTDVDTLEDWERTVAGLYSDAPHLRRK